MPRPIWKGNISFGLVNVPVQLVSAARDHSIHFNLLSDDGQCRLRRKLYCPETKKEYDFSQTARGFEIAPDHYVIVEQEELDRLKPESGKTINIEDFVDLSEIDPIYYDRPYYLIPDARSEKAYELLKKAMLDSGRAAIARFVMRTKEYLAVLRPIGDHLGLETMRFSDEVIPTTELKSKPTTVELSQREIDIAHKLIDQMTSQFEPASYKDGFRERVKNLIDKKAKGKELVVATPADTKQGELIDLMDALKKSLKKQHGVKKNAANTKRTKASKQRKQTS